MKTNQRNTTKTPKQYGSLFQTHHGACHCSVPSLRQGLGTRCNPKSTNQKSLGQCLPTEPFLKRDGVLLWVVWRFAFVFFNTYLVYSFTLLEVTSVVRPRENPSMSMLYNVSTVLFVECITGKHLLPC